MASEVVTVVSPDQVDQMDTPTTVCVCHDTPQDTEATVRVIERLAARFPTTRFLVLDALKTPRLHDECRIKTVEAANRALQAGLGPWQTRIHFIRANRSLRRGHYQLNGLHLNDRGYQILTALCQKQYSAAGGAIPYPPVPVILILMILVMGWGGVVLFTPVPTPVPKPVFWPHYFI
jgi:hypothetical protein